MLVDDLQLQEGSLPVFESEEVAEVSPVPSFEEALGDEVHEAEQEGGEEEVLWVILGVGSEVQHENRWRRASCCPSGDEGSLRGYVITPRRNWSVQEEA